MAVNYVKFFRGTPTAFENAIKNSDTLYFISETDSSKGSLYLGNKLISGNISGLADLEDIKFAELLSDGQILVYNEEQKAWINQSIIDAIGVMIGATAQTQGSIGLVPAPGAGDNDMFLRGDGVWARPDTTIQLYTDEKSLETVNTHMLTLKGFGTKFYKYIPATGSEEDGNFVAAHYEAQLVDENNPWREGLEPKVVVDDQTKELVLGWFEPNPTTVDGISDELLEIQERIDTLSEKVEENTSGINTLITDLGLLERKVDGKADSNSVYTKEQTDEKISQAILKAEHLTRKIFNSLEAAIIFAEEVENPDEYVYMVLNEDAANTNDKYAEYLYVEGFLELIGSWNTSLDGYVTDTELVEALKGKVDIKEGHQLISDADLEKLSNIEANAQKNYITSVEESEFTVTEGKLALNKISVSKVENLTALLEQKADKSTVNTLQVEVNNISQDVSTLKTSVSNLTDALGGVTSKVTNIEEQLNNFVLKTEYETDLAVIMNSITWKELDDPTI